MKFDENRPLNGQNDKQSISPQSAMDAYFDDMFGSTEEDPLKKLVSEEHELKSTVSSNKKVLNEKSKSKVVETKTHAVALFEESTGNELKPELKTKKQTRLFNLPSFEEPEININNISPLIIPAAFPKLAPLVTQTEPVEKVVIKTELKVEIPVPEVKQNVKSKLDVKAALAILEKQKSKLTIAQRQRLKEKLRLLSDAKSKVLNQTANKAEVAEKKETASVVAAKTKATQKTEIKADVKQSSISVPVTILDKQTTQVSVAAIATTTSESLDVAEQKNPRPDWANNRFECLIFSVAGLKLAVPLISLGAIYKIEKEFIPLVGRANWFMGLYHHLERNVRVIDTAQWVMPERCSPEVRASYKFIIRLGGNDWGMACDAVHQSIQLYPEQVKWRTERTKRAWLFGTVIDHMCALIDADTLSVLLNQQATKNPKIFS